ncbi:MAG: hypothetical protein D6679_08440 [Candidatus Hydrogenedentota bacterium]|nr:MAG: hypothetical protein D6679_08440 [Candidatus Hydrogenedentota bacterium]
MEEREQEIGRRLAELSRRLTEALDETARRAAAVECLAGLFPETSWYCRDDGERYRLVGEPAPVGVERDFAAAVENLLDLSRLAAFGLVPAPILSERTFGVRLGVEVRRAHRYNSKLALLLIVESSLSNSLPSEGNASSRELMEMVRGSVRESDIVGLCRSRPAVLLLAADRDTVVVVEERIRRRLGEERSKRYSFRTAFFPYDGWSDTELISKALEGIEGGEG